MNKLGLVHIYTGDGKGKTTSAIGLALRAIGHGLNVCYASFHKDQKKNGYVETEQLKKLGVKVYSFAKRHPFCDKKVSAQALRIECLNGIKTIKDKVFLDDYQVLIMDEILISIRDGFLLEEEIIEFIEVKPKNLELVMTGRGATQQLIELADYVSDISNVKHPYDHKITSRKGIEF